MSWDYYVDECLMATLEGTSDRHLSHAAIVSHDGQFWARSPNFPEIDENSIKVIMNGFSEPQTFASFQLGNIKYMVIQGEAGAVIRAKKEHSGVTIKKTHKALVFGLYDEPVTPQQCNAVVEKLGDYLLEHDL